MYEIENRNNETKGVYNLIFGDFQISMYIHAFEKLRIATKFFHSIADKSLTLSDPGGSCRTPFE